MKTFVELLLTLSRLLPALQRSGGLADVLSATGHPRRAADAGAFTFSDQARSRGAERAQWIYVIPTWCIPVQPELLGLPRGELLGRYSTYLDAQKVVDYLADNDFPVANLTIVGNDLKSVERVTAQAQLPEGGRRRRRPGCHVRRVRRPGADASSARAPTRWRRSCPRWASAWPSGCWWAWSATPSGAASATSPRSPRSWPPATTWWSRSPTRMRHARWPPSCR